MSTAAPLRVDLFNFTRDRMASDTYRRYEKAINLIWNPRDLDYTQDIADWQNLDPEKRTMILRVTCKFLAGEQHVAKEGAPLMIGAEVLDRFDWAMYMSTFVMEEFKHAEFLVHWHSKVAGILEPEEVAQYYMDRGVTHDPSGKFKLLDVAHEGVPRYNRLLLQAVLDGTRKEIEIAFVRALTTYNVVTEGILSMPSYEIVIDSTRAFGDILPTLRQGFGLILRDEGRHITSATAMIRDLVREDPSLEQYVHEIIDEFKGTLVGLVEYQRVNPYLDLAKYQTQKVRHYLNRCREMGVTPSQELVDQILDPNIDFVVDAVVG
jgi:ribonucleoside-diphosphate reductase beta chain